MAGLPGIPNNRMIHNREYHGWRPGLYMYPCDDREMDRLDAAHSLFLIAFNDRLHSAPIRMPITEESETRILDLGSGSGIWAIDMADKYHEAEVIGVDLVNKQPQAIPPNLRFRVPRDYEGPWSLGNDSFDLIYMRLACGGVSEWNDMYHKILQHLKPGIGYLEQVEIDFEPRCENGPVPTRLSEWWRWLTHATEQLNKSISWDKNTASNLERLGFADVKETILKLPLNDWPSGETDRGLGRWNSYVFSAGIEALSLGPLTEVYKWTAEQVLSLCKEVHDLSLDRNMHCYQTIHIITARRPG